MDNSKLENGVELGRQLDELEANFRRLSEETEKFSNSFSKGLSSAIESVAVKGEDLGDSLRKLSQKMANQAFNTAMEPVGAGISKFTGGLVDSLTSSILPFAKGGAIENGIARAFSQGGVVNGPQHFPMVQGMGLMGESGAEAIMPLERDASGNLGVRSSEGTRNINVHLNISTADAESFRKSKSRIAIELRNAILSGSRNA